MASIVGRAVSCLVVLLLAALFGCGAPTESRKAPSTASSRISPAAVLSIAEDGARFKQADRARRFEFPADHGPHPEYRTEWWYFTGMLRGGEDRAWGYQLTFFRQGIAENAGDSAFRADAVWMAHLALTDVRNRVHWSAERLSRSSLQLAGSTLNPLSVWVEDWRMTAKANAPLQVELRAHDQETGMRVALSLSATREPVLHGDDGWSRKSEGAASYYYSLTRLATEGVVSTERDGEVQVRGTSWLDREWSTSALDPAQRGWDWLGLHLADGVDVMLFQLRRTDGRRDQFDAGTLVHPDGTRQRLRAQDFAMRPVRYWRDAQGVGWPVAWDLNIPGYAQPLQVRSLVDDQRMNVSVSYWEGAVRVDGAVEGDGYLELTGYE